MSDLVARLRALARCEHSDFSIGDEAADEIESLRDNRFLLEREIENLHRDLDALESTSRE